MFFPIIFHWSAMDGHSKQLATNWSIIYNFNQIGHLTYHVKMFNKDNEFFVCTNIIHKQHKGLQRTANEYTERRIYKDLISKNNK